MYLVVIGLNHKTSPIEIREKLSFPENRLPEALSVLSRHPSISECAILSTCNRTEIIALSPQSDFLEDHLIRFLSEFHNIQPDIFQSHLYFHTGSIAASHLFRVAAGLDSMVLGEPQILKQVRDSFAAGLSAQSIGRVLNGLFRFAITAGKRARTETQIGAGGFSVGHAAVELAQSIFGSLNNASILILGAGKMSELTANHLISNGAKLIFVANRTHERAVSLAEKLGGAAIRYDDFPEKLLSADIVISSTSSPHFILRKDALAQMMRKRRGKPIFMIDIALPRDIEPEAGTIENLFLYDIDDLEEIVSDMVHGREVEVQKVERIVEEEVVKFMDWWRSLNAAPIVSQLQRKHNRFKEEELARLRRQLPDLSEHSWECIEAAMKSLTTKITRDPIGRLKEAATMDETSKQYTLLDAAQEIFALPEENESFDTHSQSCANTSEDSEP